MNLKQLSFDPVNLRAAYAPDDGLRPTALVAEVLRRIDSGPANIWLARHTKQALEQLARQLENKHHKNRAQLPLYGIPFAIKDNIDLAGLPTTAGCPGYAYTPKKSAQVVADLIAAGALPIGKTHLDQFATGLVGTRHPDGPCENALVPGFISGGSSSGSAVATALGQVAFALGTDTAGSGRVPAALNELIGVKPTRGLLSTRGVVPACRSLDCVSIFARTAADARIILQASAYYDPRDPFARNFAEQPAHSAPLRYGQGAAGSGAAARSGSWVGGGALTVASFFAGAGSSPPPVLLEVWPWRNFNLHMVRPVVRLHDG